MTPAFLTGLDMLKQMRALTGCCDTQPPVVVYRDRPGQSQPAAAVPDGWVLPIGPHDHPDPHVMVWSETELRSIRAYAARCVAAMLASAPQAPQQADRAMQALRVAREALALPCDRWNAVQSRIVRDALATADAVLRSAPPATPVA
jgi:hypothetical protein